MALGGGISTQANITVSLNLQKTKAWTQMKSDVAGLKTALQDLAKTVGIEKSISSYSTLQKELDKTKAALVAMTKQAQKSGQAETEASTEAARAQVVLVSKYNKTKAGLAQLAQMSEEATKGLSAGWMKMTNAGTMATDGLQKMKQAAQGVTYSFDKDGKIVGAFASEIDQADHEMRGLSQAMSMAETDTKEDAAEVKKLTDLMAGLQKSSSATSKAATAAAKAKEKADAAAALASKKLSDSAAKVRDRLKEEASAADKAKAAMSTFVGKISALEREMDAVFRASFRLKMVGMDLTMLAQRVGGFMSDIMNTFGDFQYVMNRAAGALAVSDDNMAAFQSTILDTAGTLKMFPINDVAQAMYYFGSTTGDVVDSVEGMRQEFAELTPIMQAAAMTNTSYEDTIKGVYSILAQYYNGAVGMAKEVTEELFYVTQKTAAEFPDLINSFKMVGPIAKANNVTFGQMVDLFGQLADLGVRGSMAGRAFRQIFIQMLRPSGPAIKAINEVFNLASATVKEFQGKSYFELMFPKGQFVGIEGYLKNLALATENMTQAERNSFLAKIATANELPVLTALVNKNIRALHGQADAQDKQLSSAQEASKYFQDNWKRLSESWNATSNTIKVAIDSLKVVVGSAMSEALTPFLGQVKDIIDSIRRWAQDPANKSIIQFLTKVVTVAAGLAAVSGAVLTLTGSLLGLGAAAFIMVRTFGSMFLKVGGAITGIITLGDALIRNFDEIQSSFQYAAKTISESFASTGTSIQDIMNTISDYTKILQGIMDVFVKTGATVVRIVADIVAGLNRLGVLGPMLKVVSGIILTMFSVRAVSAMLTMSRILPVLGARLIFTAGGMKAMSAAISEARLGGAVLGLGRVGTAVMGIKAAVGSLVGSIGPMGIAGIVLGVGMVAYETDFLGFKKFIDSITDAFRDLKKEAKEASSVFGSVSEGVYETAKKAAAEMYKGYTVETSASGYRGPNTSLTKKYVAKIGDQVIAYAYDMQALEGQVSRETEKAAIQIVQDWSDSVDTINEDIAKQIPNAPPISQEQYGRLMNRIFPFMPSTAAAENRKNIAKTILEGLAFGGDGRANLEKIVADVKAQASEFRNVATDDIINGVISDATKSYTQIALDKQQAIADAFYGPILKQIDYAISQGASDKVISDMLINPIKRNINGELIDGQSIADIVKTLSPDLQDMFNTFLQYLGKNSASELEDTVDTASSIFDAEWKPIADQITAALADTLVTSVYTPAMAEVGPEVKKILNNLPLIGEGADTGIAENLQIIMQKVEDEALKLPDYMKTALFQVGDLLHNRGKLTEGDYARLSKDFQSVGNDAAEIVTKSWDDMVTAFTGAVDASKRKTFSDAIKEALKRGSDVKQAGEILRSFISRSMKRALGGNLQSRQIAKDLITQNFEGLMGALGALRGPAQSKFAATIASFYTIHKKDLPKQSREGFQGILQWILDNVDLSPRQQRKIKNSIKNQIKNSIPDVNTVVKNSLSPSGAIGVTSTSGPTSALEGAINAAISTLTPKSTKASTTVAATVATTANVMPPEQSTLNTQVANVVGGAVQTASKAMSPISVDVPLDISIGTITSDISDVDWNSIGNTAGSDLASGWNLGFGTFDVPQGIAILQDQITGTDWNTMANTAGSSVGTGFNQGYSGSITLPVDIAQIVGQITGTSWSGMSNTAGKDIATGFNTGYGTTITLPGSIAGIISQINGTNWLGAGTRAGAAIASGMNTGYSSNINVVGRALGTLNSLTGLHWNFGGQRAGAAWANGLDTGIRNNIDKTLTFTASVLIGGSPPKAGPLKHIDKGGYNIGKSWGKNMSLGAEKEVTAGVHRIHRKMLGRNSGDPSFEAKVTGKRSIDININVKGSGVDKETRDSMRDAVYDALISSDILDHMVTIN